MRREPSKPRVDQTEKGVVRKGNNNLRCVHVQRPTEGCFTSPALLNPHEQTSQGVGAKRCAGVLGASRAENKPVRNMVEVSGNAGRCCPSHGP